MPEMKYIMIDDVKPVIFMAMAHDDVALSHGGPGHVTGAGFIGFRPGDHKLHTYGDSHSLGIGPGKDDDYIINHYLGAME
jgi:hypothetical protein